MTHGRSPPAVAHGPLGLPRSTRHPGHGLRRGRWRRSSAFCTTEQDFELRPRGEGDGAVEYTGIGARLMPHGAGVVIAMVVPGGAAEGAGLAAQDLIVGVDGDDATGWTMAQLVQRLRGPVGSRVAVRVRRGGGEREVVIRRAKFAQ